MSRLLLWICLGSPLWAASNGHPMEFLTALNDRIGPRLTGSPGDARACAWALDQMRKIGLRNVHAEPWTLERGWKRGHALARLIAPFEQDLSVIAYGWSGSTNGAVEADVTKVPSESRGKILLLEAGQNSEGAGAVAVVVPTGRPGTLIPHTGPVGFPYRSTSLPTLDIAEEHLRLLNGMLARGVPVRLRLDVSNDFTHSSVESNNIVGEIPGAEHPEQVVILGAHLDSWDLSPGITDDGFGVAAMLGAARALLDEGSRPKRTIRFVLFTGEEQGLLGSRAYVKAHGGELDNILCALVLDWGAGPVRKLPLAGHDEFAGIFQSLQPGSGYMTDTDAFAFTLAGVAGIAAFQDSPSYSLIAHSAADNLSQVNEGALNQSSSTMMSAALLIANSPTRIGYRFSAEKTAESLASQRRTLESLGLWLF